MQPISNNNLYNSTTSNNRTTESIQEVSIEPIQATAEYPFLNSRKITNNPSDLQSEFPSELLYLKCKNLSTEALPCEIVASWAKTIEKNNHLKNIAKIIFKDEKQIQSIQHFFDVMHKLNYKGSVKELYDAFNLLKLNKQAEELLNAAIKHAEINGNNIVKQLLKLI